MWEAEGHREKSRWVRLGTVRICPFYFCLLLFLFPLFVSRVMESAVFQHPVIGAGSGQGSSTAGTEVLGLCHWVCGRYLSHIPCVPQLGQSALAATWPLRGPAAPLGYCGQTLRSISALCRQHLGKEPAWALPALSEKPASASVLLSLEAQKSVLRCRSCSALWGRASQAGPAASARDSPLLPPSCLFPRLPPRIPEDFVRVPHANITPTWAQRV